eukprot:340609-Rhodomonas_salina.2
MTRSLLPLTYLNPLFTPPPLPFLPHDIQVVSWIKGRAERGERLVSGERGNVNESSSNQDDPNRKGERRLQVSRKRGQRRRKGSNDKKETNGKKGEE